MIFYCDWKGLHTSYQRIVTGIGSFQFQIQLNTLFRSSREWLIHNSEQGFHTSFLQCNHQQLSKCGCSDKSRMKGISYTDNQLATGHYESDLELLCADGRTLEKLKSFKHSAVRPPWSSCQTPYWEFVQWYRNEFQAMTSDTSWPD